MRWEQGRPLIDGMLGRGELPKAEAIIAIAERLLDQMQPY